MKKIAIVIPLYNEEGNLNKLVSELEAVIMTLKGRYTFEIIFVNDGSTDNSYQKACQIHSRYFSIKTIDLSRNFGKEAATSAGLHEAKANAVLIMDGDLQHPPRYIPKFIENWENGFQIIASRRISFEKRSIGKRIGSFLFYKILNIISDTEVVSKSTDFRLLDEQVVNELVRFTERSRMVRGLIDWMGFRKTYIEFEAPKRFAGTESYSLKALFRLAINSFTMFSMAPLRFAGYFGLFLCAVFGLLMAYMIFDRMTYNAMGFTSIAFIIVSNTLLIGIVLVCLGLIALYIGNIHIEVVNRPLYIIREIVRVQTNKKKHGAKIRNS